MDTGKSPGFVPSLFVLKARIRTVGVCIFIYVAHYSHLILLPCTFNVPLPLYVRIMPCVDCKVRVCVLVFNYFLILIKIWIIVHVRLLNEYSQMCIHVVHYIIII